MVWWESLPEDVGGGVVVVLGRRLDLMKFALNPFEVKVLSDLKRTTIVLLLDTTGFGIAPPQNLPLMDIM